MSEPLIEQSRDLLKQLQADPSAAAAPNPILLQTWQSISSELLRLIDHIEGDVDPVLKMLGALVGGFHGIEPEADTEMGELFALGALQRARVDQLEEQIGELTRAVTDLAAAIRPRVDLLSDTQDGYLRQPQLRRLAAAPVPSDSHLR
jgi:hypothetical protein